MDSSSEDFEDLNCIEGDLDPLDDDEISDGATKKPHFLDYDAAPPTGEELQFSCYSSLPGSNSGQSLNGLVVNNVNTNDLDKNNTNEKSVGGPAPSNVPCVTGEGSSSGNNNRILLTRRRSLAEGQQQPTSLVATGAKKKEFSTGYHSLDYETTVPINKRYVIWYLIGELNLFY